MAEAYIVAAARTAGGRRNGVLRDWHPADLAAEVLDALIARAGIDPAALEDVIMGCVTQAGEQSLHVGRNAVLASNLPQSVPAVTIDRQCGSSQQAIQFAAQAVMSGTQDVVIAAGVESMSRVPMGLSMVADKGFTPFPASVTGKYGVPFFSQFIGAEMIAAKYAYPREKLDDYAYRSHVRAREATEAGAFAGEIVPVEITLPDGSAATHAVDEGIRFDASLEGIAAVKLLREGGVISAASASQICDGSAAVMIVSE